MKTRFTWISIALLVFALVGQFATYRLQGPTSTAHASWAFHPKSFAEARGRAKSIVLAEVTSVERGEDLVMPVEGEPNGEDRIPTQQVTLKVLKGYKGGAKAGQTLTLFQTGGTVLPPPPPEGTKEAVTDVQQVILEGDPLYQQGEKYLLLLEPGPKGMLRTISPEGRYRHQQNDTLSPMVDNEVTREVRGKTLASIERSLH
jgi:hypothetical protein